MSFKRDGNDTCALNDQRKRRVTELLYEDIHDGEVSRLSNGRFVCSICPHQPIFDTINMFQVHRQGKKHEQSVIYKEKEKLELKNLIEKRKHEQFVKANTNQTKPQSTIPEGPRVLGGGFSSGGSGDTGKKHSNTIHHRKITLNLKGPVPGSSTTDATPEASLPGNQSHYKNTEAWETSRVNDMISAHMKCMRKKPTLKHKDVNEDKIQTRSQHATVNTKESLRTLPNHSDSEKEVNARNIGKFVGTQNCEQTSKYYFARRQQSKGTITTKPQRTESGQPDKLQQHASKSWEYFKTKTGRSSAPTQKQKDIIGSQTSIKTQALDMAADGSAGVCGENPGMSTVKPPREHEATVEERKERAEKFLHAYSSGWKKDWTGKWIQDEDVEFDSDEEPPNVS